MAKKPSESPVVTAVLRACEAAGIMVTRTQAGTMRWSYTSRKTGKETSGLMRLGKDGWPDVTAILPGGLAMVVECKLPKHDLTVTKIVEKTNKNGKKTTKVVDGQLETLTRLWRQGARIVILYAGMEEQFTAGLQHGGQSPYTVIARLIVYTNAEFTPNVRRLVEACSG